VAKFEEVLPAITAVASHLSYVWQRKFEVDELVNEAWIRGSDVKQADAPLLVSRAKLDMIDYIRHQLGRVGTYLYKGQVKHKKPHPVYITNLDSEAQEEFNHPNSFFDGEKTDKNLEHLENEELLMKLLLHEPSPEQLASIFYHYFEEMTLREVGGILNRSESNICQLVKKGLDSCREKLAVMEI